MKRPTAVLGYSAWQLLRCLTRHYRATADYLAGFNPPDPRDQELRDRGAELAWKVSVQQNNRAKREQLRAEIRTRTIRPRTWNRVA